MKYIVASAMLIALFTILSLPNIKHKQVLDPGTAPTVDNHSPILPVVRELINN